MGWSLFGLLKSGPERRVARARELLAIGQYNDARLELEGVEHPDAPALLAEALESLIQVNLLEWRAQRGAGQGVAAEAALGRARRFGATTERIDAFKASPDTTVIGFGHRLPPRA